MHAHLWDADGGFYEIYFEGAPAEISGFYVCVMGTSSAHDYGYNW